ncbi:MAG: TRL-like family protein [Pseudomonadota bacterium]
MKKVLSIAIVAAAATLAGCAAAPFQPGLLYTQQSLPLDASDEATKCAKTGTGTTTNILGLFATGDASIASAKKSAGITKVDTVDVSHTGILGLFSATTTKVCGE